MTHSLWSLEELNYKVVYNESYDLELIRSRCYNIWMVSAESQEPCVWDRTAFENSITILKILRLFEESFTLLGWVGHILQLIW